MYESGDHVARRDDLDEAKRRPQRQGELSREDVQRHLARHARPTDGLVVDSQQTRSANTHHGQRRKDNKSGGLVRRRLAKSKTKKNKAEHRGAFMLLMINL